MSREYNPILIEDMNARTVKTVRDGVKMIIKPLPETDQPGVMDLRLWDKSKFSSILTPLIPESILDIDLNDINIINRMRKPFNHIDSVPMVESDIKTEEYWFESFDQQKIRMCQFYQGQDLKDKPILYYIHGGGFFAGRTEVVSEALKLWVERFDVVIYSIDYRLAPEYPYPVGHQDTYAGLQWILKHANNLGGDTQKIFIAGDSAGGNLAQYCTHRDLEDNHKNIKGQLLLYPTLNMASIQDEYTQFHLDKFKMHPKHKRAIEPAIKAMAAMSPKLSDILKTDDINNKYLSPYIEPDKDNPPTFITYGEHDYLKLESFGYAKKLTDLNIDTTVLMYRGIAHAYIDQIGVLPQAEDCINEMGAWMIEVLDYE